MILVFGRSGQVASELQRFDEVIACDRTRADLSNPQACANLIKHLRPRAVINAAAYTAVDQAETEVHLAQTINCDAPGAMARACAELGIPFVHISTDYVFDGTGSLPWQVTDLPNPINAYGMSKFLGEKAIVRENCYHVILRTSWIFSAFGDNFVKTMRRLSEQNYSLNVVDDQVGGPTFAGDIARACINVAKQMIKNPQKFGVYQFSGQPDVSWCQFANSIFDQMGSKTVACPIPTSHYPTPAERPLNSRLDCSKLRDVFGIDRPYWHQGMNRTLMELEKKNGFT